MQLFGLAQTKDLRLVTCTKIEGEMSNDKEDSIQLFYSLESEGLQQVTESRM